jgi:hypothetical protein
VRSHFDIFHSLSWQNKLWTANPVIEEPLAQSYPFFQGFLPSHPSISKLLWVSPEFSVLICLLQLKVKEWEQLTFGAQLFIYPIYLNALLPHPISSFTCLT